MNILDIFFPRKCLGCSSKGVYLCSKCLKKTKSPRLTCPRCNGFSPDGVVHIRCHDRPGLNGRVSLWRHTGPIRKAITGLKYKFAFDIAEELAAHAVNNIFKKKYFFPKNSVLVPIPLYWYRQNWRGFNQSTEIGRMIAQKMGWGFDKDLLVRKASRKPQVSLEKEKRKTNIKGAFVLNKRPNKSIPVILFDDVWTTGSTAKEAGRLLKKAGVKKVNCLTLTS